MNVLSLFSGIGGLELGLERAGMTVVGQVEIDEFCRKVLAKHWPEVPRHDDVRTCVEWWRGESRPAVHVVAGGFPCQPVSNAGLRLGEDDERWLWPAYLAVVRDLRPSYAVMENVAALLGRGADIVLGDLAACGYDAEWDCIPAAAVGAPHRRDRWFCIAHPASDGWGSGRAGRPAAHGSARPDGFAAEELANPDGSAGGSAPRDAVSGTGGPAVHGWPQEPRRRGGDVANPDGTRLEGPGRLHDPASGGWPGALAADDGWWSVEPDVGRVAHGVPARVDRLRSLGNAVVPQVAEHVGRLVMAAAS